MQFIDSHCHLDFPDFSGQLDALLESMRAQEVVGALCVAVSLEGFAGVLRLAETDRRLLATVGVHPDHAAVTEPTVPQLVELAAHPKVVAIGETGLDYYRLAGDLEWQRDRFRTHIRAARQCRKPLVIHTRAAAADTLRIMREENAAEVGGVMHCFTETWEVAEAALDMGFHISFSGILTFRKAEALRDVAQRTPLDRILIETDAPYLAPVPHRGKRNQPAYVRYVAEELARLRLVPLEDIAAGTTRNFFRLFPDAGNFFSAAA